MASHHPTAAPGNLQLPTVLQSGALSTLDDQAKSLIFRQMHSLSLRAGDHAFRPGDSCSNYLMVKAGSIKVTVATESGREIVLYRVQDGETCVLTSACLLSGSDYDAEAVAERETEAIILPKVAFEELLASSARFRHFVFSSYGERLQDLIALVQEVTLRHVDRRLARLLLAQAHDGVVQSTHQALASELNSAREVITRLLHDFAERNWVHVTRGRIRLQAPDALAKLADTL